MQWNSKKPTDLNKFVGLKDVMTKQENNFFKKQGYVKLHDIKSKQKISIQNND